VSRTPFGARVRLTPEGGRTQARDLSGGGSYLSASERKVFFAVGDARQIARLEVTWPGGETETWHDLPATPVVRVVAGTGAP
jgi:hypothetical protein